MLFLCVTREFSEIKSDIFTEPSWILGCFISCIFPALLPPPTDMEICRFPVNLTHCIKNLVFPRLCSANMPAGWKRFIRIHNKLNCCMFAITFSTWSSTFSLVIKLLLFFVWALCAHDVHKATIEIIFSLLVRRCFVLAWKVIKKFIDAKNRGREGKKRAFCGEKFN